MKKCNQIIRYLIVAITYSAFLMLYEKIIMTNIFTYPFIGNLDFSDDYLSLFVWMVPTLFLLYFVIQWLFDYYRNVLFVIVRIKNRGIWLLKVFVNVNIHLIYIILIKYGLYFIFDNTMNINSAILTFINYLCLINIITLITLLLYQIFKREFVANLIFMVYMALVLSTTNITELRSIMLMNSNNVLTAIVSVFMVSSLFIVNVILLNKLDFY